MFNKTDRVAKIHRTQHFLSLFSKIYEAELNAHFTIPSPVDIKKYFVKVKRKKIHLYFVNFVLQPQLQ